MKTDWSEYKFEWSEPIIESLIKSAGITFNYSHVAYSKGGDVHHHHCIRLEGYGSHGRRASGTGETREEAWRNAVMDAIAGLSA